MSSQPIFGGPVYFIRNAMYHVASGVGFKFSAKPAGLYVFHNTLITEHVIRDPYSNVHWRNNLVMGTGSQRGVVSFSNATAYSTFDYNGYRPNPGAKGQYSWLSPKSPGERLYEPSMSDWRTFDTLADLRAATGQEAHGVEVDYDIFESMRPPDPAGRHAVYHAVDLNFKLKAGSKAVDAGVALPTVNDGFAGRAPDLGAIEVGGPEPVYGARRWAGKSFYR
jgi:hypothetical protein